MENTKEKFIEYLIAKGLTERTIKDYFLYYKHFEKGLEDHELDQSYVNQFLMNNNSSPKRAFLSNLFDCLDVNLKIPKLTGRKRHREKRSLTTQELEVLRQWLYVNKNKRYVLCIDLSYSCALRRSELMKIKIEDLELTQWAEDPTRSCKLLIHGKGNQERYVPIESKLMYRIIDYIQEMGKESHNRLFAFSYREWDHAFKDAVKSTMDYNFTLHDLRRSRATQWLKDGIDLIRVKNRLGHASVSTTQLYINLEKEQEFSDWAKE